MKVLIAGSSGFIGQQLQRHYSKTKDEVRIFDIAYGEDARDFFRTSRESFDLVWMMAGVIGGRRGIEGQPLSVAVDLSIDAEYFNWIERVKPTHAVYMSSSAAYPTSLQMDPGYRLREDDIDLANVMNPDYTYGWSKLTGEYLAQFVTQTKMHIFRPFSGYGGNQALDYPFPSFIDRAKRKKDPFHIWGDGKQVRDFIHIVDLVNAMFAAIDQGVEGPVNLGWGRATSFNELAEIVCAEAGYSPEFQHLLTEPVGVQYRVCDNSKMLDFYQPKISLEEGVHLAMLGVA